MCKDLNKTQWIWILILLSFIVVGGSYLFFKNKINWNQLKPRFDIRKKPNWFFKKLHVNNTLNQIATVMIETNGEKLTILNQNNDWVILEKDNYLALPVKIKELIFGLADLKIVDSKTSNPDNFSAIDLKDLTSSNDTTKITFFTKDHEEIDSIYLGKREFIASPNSNYQTYIFVRRPSENQTWLVAGNLPEGFSFKELVAQPLINLDMPKIYGLKLIKVKDPKNYIYIKRNLANGELKLTDIPKGYKLKDQYLLDSIIQQFTYLNYDDVIKDPGDAVSVLTGELFLLEKDINQKIISENQEKDPKKINFELVFLKDNYYLKFNSKLDNENINHWLYKISDYTCQSLLINKTDLLDQI